jgi:segregation and condensation protein A
MGDGWDLDESSEFLVVAATLLDLKAARLLPAASVEDEADLALLEARDLLFARLLQYKAFKEAAAHLAQLELSAARRWPRAVQLEPRYAEALPELVLGIGPQRLAALAMKAFAPKPMPTVSIAHIHLVRVSVREHAGILRDRLLRQRVATFRALCADCQNTLEVVARFLALLELFREGVVSFDQVQALGELTVRWIGGDDAAVTHLDIDEYGEESVDNTAEDQPDAEEEEGIILTLPSVDLQDTDGSAESDAIDAAEADSDLADVDEGGVDLVDADRPDINLADTDQIDADQADAGQADAGRFDAELGGAGRADVDPAVAGEPAEEAADMRSTP